ncbi:MAG TPA: hypothetical protein VGA67_04255, partial [Candidatus Dojkabacteria bacterium]
MVITSVVFVLRSNTLNQINSQTTGSKAFAQSIDIPGGGLCSFFGMNTATHIGSMGNAIERTEALGGNWTLGIVNSVDDFRSNLDRMCSGNSNVVVRPCVGDGDGTNGHCGLLDTQLEEFVQALNEVPADCNIYVTGPNEAPRELLAHYGSLEAVADAAVNFSNALIGNVPSNVRIGTTVVDPAFPTYNEFMGLLNSRGYNWQAHDFAAVNAYNNNNIRAYDFINGNPDNNISGLKPFIGNTPILITETGMVERREGFGGVDRATAIQHLIETLENFNNDPQILGALLFNGLGLNTSDGFDFNDLSPEELQQILSAAGCSAVGSGGVTLSDPGFDGTGNVNPSGNPGGVTPNYFDGKFILEAVTGPFNGCAEYLDELALESTDQLVSKVELNHDTGALDNALLSYVPMKETCTLPPQDPNYEAVCSNWELRYVETTFPKNTPLVHYFSEFDPEGTEAHKFSTTGIFDENVNYYSNVDFSNIFEGLAKFEDSEGESFTMPLPQLGTTTLTGSYYGDDYLEPERIHCGAYYDKISKEFREKYEYPLAGPNTDQFDGQEDSFFAKLFRTLNTFDLASSTIRDQANQKLLPLGLSEVTCQVPDKQLGLESGLEINICDHSDSTVNPERTYQIVTGGEPDGKIFSPTDMCNLMLSTKGERKAIRGGTCFFPEINVA